jgi:hypothetical protein
MPGQSVFDEERFIQPRLRARPREQSPAPQITPENYLVFRMSASTRPGDACPAVRVACPSEPNPRDLLVKPALR